MWTSLINAHGLFASGRRREMRCVAFLVAMLAQFSYAGDVSGMVIKAR